MHFDAEFYVACGFVLFVLMLGYFGVHRWIAGALDGRTNQIASELAEAKRLREEAESVLASYKQKAADAENPTYLKLVKIYQETQAVQDGVLEMGSMVDRQIERSMPALVERDIPPVGELKTKTPPRIYFGEQSPAYSIVGRPKGSNPIEVDIPRGGASGGEPPRVRTDVRIPALVAARSAGAVKCPGERASRSEGPIPRIRASSRFRLARCPSSARKGSSSPWRPSSTISPGPGPLSTAQATLFR